jgi:hypothetical protein
MALNAADLTNLGKSGQILSLSLATAPGSSVPLANQKTRYRCGRSSPCSPARQAARVGAEPGACREEFVFA